MLELTNLDDKPYRQILEELVDQIPVWTDRWTDFNPQDTGMVLLELMATLTETQRYYLNQVDERYYHNYLELAMPTDRMQNRPSDAPHGSEALEQRIERFRDYCSSTVIAVTHRDYEDLTMQISPELDAVGAFTVDGMVTLYVFRKQKPLSDRELEQLYQFLKVRTLLGTRLRILQTEEYLLQIACRLLMNPEEGQPERCEYRLRQALDRLFQQAEREIPDEQEIRAVLLSFPEVRRIVELQMMRPEQWVHPIIAWRAEVQLDFCSGME